MNVKSLLLVIATTGSLLLACSGPDGTLSDEDQNGNDQDGGPGSDGGVGPACAPGKTYATFGGDVLGADRIQANAGLERRRFKSFASLKTEYVRALGAAPASLTGAGGTFGEPEKRWFTEPGMSAVVVHTNYLIAFEGCLDYLADPVYQADPTDATARTECAKLGRKFWSRDLLPQEIDTCATLATTGLASETTAKRKWANVCASMLTSAGFLTY